MKQPLAPSPTAEGAPVPPMCTTMPVAIKQPLAPSPTAEGAPVPPVCATMPVPKQPLAPSPPCKGAPVPPVCATVPVLQQPVAPSLRRSGAPVPSSCATVPVPKQPVAPSPPCAPVPPVGATVPVPKQPVAPSPACEGAPVPSASATVPVPKQPVAPSASREAGALRGILVKPTAAKTASVCMKPEKDMQMKALAKVPETEQQDIERGTYACPVAVPSLVPTLMPDIVLLDSDSEMEETLVQATPGKLARGVTFDETLQVFSPGQEASTLHVDSLSAASQDAPTATQNDAATRHLELVPASSLSPVTSPIMPETVISLLYESFSAADEPAWTCRMTKSLQNLLKLGMMPQCVNRAIRRRGWTGSHFPSPPGRELLLYEIVHALYSPDVPVPANLTVHLLSDVLRVRERVMAALHLAFTASGFAWVGGTVEALKSLAASDELPEAVMPALKRHGWNGSDLDPSVATSRCKFLADVLCEMYGCSFVNLVVLSGKAAEAAEKGLQPGLAPEGNAPPALAGPAIPSTASVQVSLAPMSAPVCVAIAVPEEGQGPVATPHAIPSAPAGPAALPVETVLTPAAPAALAVQSVPTPAAPAALPKETVPLVTAAPAPAAALPAEIAVPAPASAAPAVVATAALAASTALAVPETVAKAAPAKAAPAVPRDEPTINISGEAQAFCVCCCGCACPCIREKCTCRHSLSSGQSHRAQQLPREAEAFHGLQEAAC